MSEFRPTDPTIFFTRHDPHDPRLGELFRSQSLEKALKLAPGFALCGYPDDEGIVMNGGRPGAALAPVQIRKYFYKMTPGRNWIGNFFDLGDLAVGTNIALPDRHEFAQRSLRELFKVGHRVITFGGGHDYGFADAAAFLDSVDPGEPHRPIVINFDAHLDVRPFDKGFHSGTPFRRLLENYSARFDFVEVGLQPQCNSTFHREYALKYGARLLDLERIHSEGLLKCLTSVLPLELHHHKDQKVWISVDLDAFSSAFAPGCSQSFATGLEPVEFLQSLAWILKNSDVRGMGFYETSPALDLDDRTSKLAATLAYYFLRGSL